MGINLSTRLKNKITLIRKFLFDIFLPKICVVCRKDGELLCHECAKLLPTTQYPICPNPSCQKKLIKGWVCENCRYNAKLTRFFACLSYQNEIVKNMIRQFKYYGIKDFAPILGKIIINFLVNNFFEAGLMKERVVLIPIPLQNKRLRERGFNQSEEIAIILGKHFKIPVISENLVKIKNTAPQAEISELEKRMKNISGAFRCDNPENIQGKIVILVDDVYTTGSTMKECAKILRQAKAKQVWGIAIARG